MDCTGGWSRIVCKTALNYGCIAVLKQNNAAVCVITADAGYLIVYNPYCELYHYESKSRGYEDTPEKIERFGREIATVEKHWPGIFQTPDPYYNPNLTLDSQDFSIKRI